MLLAIGVVQLLERSIIARFPKVRRVRGLRHVG
jgi:hypothetical protein